MRGIQYTIFFIARLRPVVADSVDGGRAPSDGESVSAEKIGQYIASFRAKEVMAQNESRRNILSNILDRARLLPLEGRY